MELLIILVLIAMLFIWHRSLAGERGRLKSEIQELREELDRVNSELNGLRDKIEYMSLNEREKEELAFENAPDLPLSFFEKLKKGQIINLMSGSYFYPSEEISITRFQYKHDRLDKENKTDFGWEVHGFEKFSDADEWTPCTFLVDEHECKTSSCAGKIKKAI